MSYLEQKGHVPVKALTSGRLSYLCPMPWHAETKPSFVVWTNSEFENFYCFGCLAKYNIIHLMSMLDGISARQAIFVLSDGMEFTVDDEKILAERDLEKYNWINDPQQQEVFSRALLEISDICNAFLRSVDHSPVEVKIIDKLWQVVDDSLKDYEFESIEKIRRDLGALITSRKDLLRSKEIAEIQKTYEGVKNE